MPTTMKATAFNYVLALGLALLVAGPSIQKYVGSIATSFYVFGIVITFVGFSALWGQQ